jgi:hypothetical protein
MMKNAEKVLHFLNKNQLYIIIIFFAVYLITGLFLYNDYGLGVDETIQRNWGNEYYNLILYKDPANIMQQGIYYGPFFQIILAFQENLLGLQDSRAAFLSYHLSTFLFFYLGVICLYFLAKKIFKDWKYSLLSCVMMILTPRIFADSFYNPKDIPLLTLFIMSALTMMIMYEKPTILTAVIHGITSAAVIDTRIIGVIMPGITLVVFFIAFFLRKDFNRTRLVLTAGIYLVSTFIFTVLFWPMLYFDLGIFTDTIKYMNDFPYALTLLYRGQMYHCYELYRSYLPTWLGITIPIPYILFFLVGNIALIIGAIIKIKQIRSLKDNIGYLIALAWFFIPFMYVVIFRPCVYNGWRHFFFIYPAFVLIAVHGIKFLFSKLEYPKLDKRFNLTGKFILSLVILASMVNTMNFMIVNHPYQYLYFNRLAGSNMEEIQSNYEMDYWGVSYRKALEYIVQNDPSPLIKIVETTNSLKYNASLLKPEDRERLYFCYPSEEPNYLVIEGKPPSEGYPGTTLFYSIDVNNARIVSVYKYNR